MIPRETNRIRRILQGAILFLGIVLVVWVCSRILVFVMTGAEWQTAVAIETDVDVIEQSLAVWDDPVDSEGDTLALYLQQQLKQSYLAAWRALCTAHETGDPMILQDHFAPQCVSESVFAPDPHIQIHVVDLTHHLSLQTISRDREFVSFTDQNVFQKTEIISDEHERVSTTELFLDVDVIMKVLDGRWKITSFQSRPARAQKKRVATDTLRPQKTGTPFPVIRGINYYPRSAPWEEMWEKFPLAEIEQDFALLGKHGLNTIRIFMPDVATQAELVTMTARLDTLLGLAQRHGLQCLVTLFDFPLGIRLARYPAYANQLRMYLTTFKAHAALLGWDLKNEPDLDFAHYGEDRVVSWLSYLVKLARETDPFTPLTIGWSDYRYSHILMEEVDFISFHDYSQADSLLAHLHAVTALAGLKPVVITETGMTTCQSYLVPGGHTEADQEAYVAIILPEIVRLSNGFMLWTMYDFPEIPRKITGFRIWRRCSEAHFGIFRSDGSAKPAMRQISTLEHAPVFNRKTWPLRPFQQTLVCILLIGMVSGYLFWRYQRKSL